MRGDVVRRENHLPRLARGQHGHRGTERIGAKPARQPVWRRQGGERLRRGGDRLGQGRDQGEAAKAFRVVEREGQGNGAAERMADDQRLAQIERGDDFGDDIALRLEGLRWRGLGIAGAGPVDQDGPPLGKQLRQRIGKIAELAHQPMHEDERRLRLPRPVAAVDDMQAQAIDLDEASLRRNQRLDEAAQGEIEQDQRADGGEPPHEEPEKQDQQRHHAHLGSKCSAPSSIGPNRKAIRSRR